MSFRAVELQFALHKNSDAAHLQQQLQQRPAADQMHAAAQSIKQAEMQRNRSSKAEEAAHASIKKDEASGDGRQRRQQEKRSPKHEEKAAEDKPAHPYKGRHIDLSL